MQTIELSIFQKFLKLVAQGYLENQCIVQTSSLSFANQWAKLSLCTVNVPFQNYVLGVISYNKQYNFSCHTVLLLDPTGETGGAYKFPPRLTVRPSICPSVHSTFPHFFLHMVQDKSMKVGIQLKYQQLQIKFNFLSG